MLTDGASGEQGLLEHGPAVQAGIRRGRRGWCGLLHVVHVSRVLWGGAVRGLRWVGGQGAETLGQPGCLVRGVIFRDGICEGHRCVVGADGHG